MKNKFFIQKNVLKFYEFYELHKFLHKFTKYRILQQFLKFSSFFQLFLRFFWIQFFLFALLKPRLFLAVWEFFSLILAPLRSFRPSDRSFNKLRTFWYELLSFLHKSNGFATSFIQFIVKRKFFGKMPKLPLSSIHVSKPSFTMIPRNTNPYLFIGGRGLGRRPPLLPDFDPTDPKCVQVC